MNLPDPRGSEPGFRRPVLVLQSDAFNQSNLATVICVTLTSQLKWAAVPGNVRLSTRETGLDKTSVANVSQLVTLDRDDLEDRQGRIPRRKLKLVFAGLDILLGR